VAKRTGRRRGGAAAQMVERRRKRCDGRGGGGEREVGNDGAPPPGVGRWGFLGTRKGEGRVMESWVVGRQTTQNDGPGKTTRGRPREFEGIPPGF
jgi:hypothetical protein